MAGYSQEFRSWVIADGFRFFGQYESGRRSLTLWVSAYSLDQLIGQMKKYSKYHRFPLQHFSQPFQSHEI